jgi:hypothetical protein
MVLDLPIKSETPDAKNNAVPDFPSQCVSVFPSYFAEFTEFFPAHSHRVLMRFIPSTTSRPGQIALISCNISVA